MPPPQHVRNTYNSRPGPRRLLAHLKMAGSDPPFQMPGYWWDKDKKRFFKDTPGPVAEAPSASSPTTSGPSSVTADSAERRASVRLPALSIAAASTSSAFHSSRVDPVTLRSLGGSVRSHGIDFSRHATKSAYAQLALSQARRLNGASARYFQVSKY